LFKQNRWGPTQPRREKRQTRVIEVQNVHVQEFGTAYWRSRSTSTSSSRLFELLALIMASSSAPTGAYFPNAHWQFLLRARDQFLNFSFNFPIVAPKPDAKFLPSLSKRFDGNLQSMTREAVGVETTKASKALVQSSSGGGHTIIIVIVVAEEVIGEDEVPVNEERMRDDRMIWR